MKGSLLWVYEGLTQYLGDVLAARSGLRSLEQARDAAAWTAHLVATSQGRTWRPLADTAVAASVLYGARKEGQARRRGVDFYGEGYLLWLEADAVIRARSGGARLLDDFCRAFFGAASGRPEVRPYDLGKEADHSASLGILLKLPEGRIRDVVPGSPADRAGLAPAALLLGVNGRRFTPERLLEALAGGAEKVDLLVEDAEMFRTAEVRHSGGPRYPVLERDPSRPDLLSAILAPRAR